jgi:multidrug efflux pump subunit AcrA (membrane-fusion protein)
VPDQGRFGAGSQQSIVAQGENVKEGQKLLRIPNLGKMQVNVRVHEAMVSRLRPETLRPTGYSDALSAALLLSPAPLHLGQFFPVSDVLAIVGTQLALADARASFRDRDFELTFAGQPASIRVEAYPNRQLRGHVKSVATVPSQTDFLSTDVKVYPTIVSIDEAVENLRPGFSAEVIIHAEESEDEVLTIPIQAVVGNISMGAKRKCFVVDRDGQPQERDIVVGISNIRMVEVKEGLGEGEQVVLNPRALLGENSKLRPAVLPTQKNGNGDAPDGGGAGEGKKKKSGKGGGDRAKQAQQMFERFQRVSPAERRDMLNQVPEQFRDKVRQQLKAKGLEIAN